VLLQVLPHPQPLALALGQYPDALRWRAHQPRVSDCTAARAASMSAGEVTRLGANRM
jgi:hypothetical protein